MTQIQSTRSVKRETSIMYRGRPLMIELHPGYLTLREKGKRSKFSVDYRAVYDLAMKLEARERQAEKQAMKKAKRGRR